MARDFKNRTSKPKRKPIAEREADANRSGLFKGLFFGVLIGASASSAWFLSRPTAVPTDCPAASSAQECPEQALPFDPAEIKTYDYYHLLPGLEVVVPEEAPARPNQPARPRPAPNPAATYMLQVGSFTNSVDAERRKAELAFLGLLANVHTAAIDANTTYYRLRMGPFKGGKPLSDAQALLDSNNIEALLIRVSD